MKKYEINAYQTLQYSEIIEAESEEEAKEIFEWITNKNILDADELEYNFITEIK